MRPAPSVQSSLAALALAIMACPAHAMAVFDAIYARSSSTASLQSGATTVQNTDVETNSSSSFMPSLAVTSAYSAMIGGSPDVATASSTATLTLSSASSGLAELKSGAGLDLSTAGASGAAHTGGNTGEPTNYIAYAFTDAHPFEVTISYDDSQVGSETGYFGPYTNTQGGGPLGLGTYPTNGSGSVSQRFGPGFLQLEFYDDIYSADSLQAGSPASLASNTDYKFSFSITDVPEPAAWTLMLTGLGLAGGALRRRRSVLFT